MGAPGGIVYDQDALEKYHTFIRYGQAKLANILHARELQRRHPSITSTALHPGVILTDLYNSQKQTNPLMTVAIPLIKLIALDVPGGAKNQLWAATANKEEVKSSHYWKPVGMKSGGAFWIPQERCAKELWDWTEGQCEEQLKKMT